MIIFLNNGRLGNQLFHYAFLLSQARKDETVLMMGMDELVELLDMQTPNFRHVRTCRIVHQILGHVILPLLTGVRFVSEIRILRSADGTSELGLVRTRGVLRSVRIVSADFYQSEFFFDPDQVKTFSIRPEHIQSGRAFMDGLPRDKTKVFIHVRRGDYCHEEVKGIKDISLPKRYFERAVAVIRQHVADPFFIILSDDKAWCEDNFRSLSQSVISDCSVYTDFAIMTMCHAGVVSNSSFSWWGAYLMTEPKVVVSPKYWYGWKIKKTFPLGIRSVKFTDVDF